MRSKQNSTLFIEELTLLKDAISRVEGISAILKNLAQDHTFTYHFVTPLWHWIDTIQWPCFDPPEVHSDLDHAATQVGLTIDTMLIDVQEILKVATSSDSTEDPTAEDRFLTRGLSQVMKCTQSLNIDGIIAQLQELLVTLPGAPAHDTSNAVGYILPFLERYLLFVDSQLINHHCWTNVLFKLTYISCSIVRRICIDGFCQPAPEGEGKEGEGKESADGVGMGEGTGRENISEEITEESQVEGLQDAEAGGDTEKEKGGEDKAIEMSQDIGGELEDVGSQDEEEDDESGDESEVEDKVEELDANDPHAVDEKLWGDEQGKEPKGSDEKVEKDPRSKQQGISEVVAKEDEGEHGEGKEGEDQVEKVETDMQEDIPEANEEQPGAQGAPTADRIDETETLDLPEDLQMAEDDVRKGDDDDSVSVDDEGDPEDETVMQDTFPDQEDVSVSDEVSQANDELDTNNSGQPGETEAENSDSSQKPDLTNPDLRGGADQDNDGIAEPSADTDKEAGKTGGESKRAQGGQNDESDEQHMVLDW